MMLERLTQIYVAVVALVSVAGLIYIYAWRPDSMFKTREGVAYFTPKVADPETGKPLNLRDLIRHYRGD